MKHTTFTTTRSARRLSEIEFAAWVGAAEPGDRLEYHRGYPRGRHASPLSPAARARARGTQASSRTAPAGRPSSASCTSSSIGTAPTTTLPRHRPAEARSTPRSRSRRCSSTPKPPDHPPTFIRQGAPNALPEQLSPAAGPARPAAPGDRGAARRRARGAAAGERGRAEPGEGREVPARWRAGAEVRHRRPPRPAAPRARTPARSASTTATSPSSPTCRRRSTGTRPSSPRWSQRSAPRTTIRPSTSRPSSRSPSATTPPGRGTSATASSRRAR